MTEEEHLKNLEHLRSPKVQKITLEVREEKRRILSILNHWENPDRIVAVKINGLTQSLNAKIHRNCVMDIEPIYRTSVAGEAILNGSVPTVEFLHEVNKRMVEIAKKDIKVRVRRLYHRDAVKYFTKVNLVYTIKLVSSLNTYHIPVDECDGFMQMHHRVLVHNVSALKGIDFHISKRSKGWALIFKFSKWREYYQPSEMSDERIIEINRKRGGFVKSIKVECVGDVNRLVNLGEDYIDEFVQLNRMYQDMEMNHLIRNLTKDHIEKKGTRLILIAGPSASGKTTFAKKLKWSLALRGIESTMLSVDNYFKPREESPRDPVTGKYDFEQLAALRVDKMNDDISRLFKGEKVWLPHFDFVTGLPTEKGELMELKPGSLLIMEGIHCLNDNLTPKISRDLKFKTFLAPFTPIKLEDRNYISNKVIRLFRRMVRDEITRGHKIEFTLGNWPHVLRGEHMYIFPFIKEADFIFNSALDYEISVLKTYAEPMLKAVKPSSEHFDLARELLIFCKKFEGIPYKYVPRDSLLQEFIGGHWRNN